MINKFKKLTTGQLIFGTALVLVMVFVVKGIAGFAVDRASRANGSLSRQIYVADDFETSGILGRDDGTHVSIDNDPQMIITGYKKLSTVKFYAKFSILPGEMTMYYTTAEDVPFSERKRVWFSPVVGQDGWYEANMNMKEVYAIRIDPTMYAGNIMEFGDFILNEEKPFTDFFTLSYSSFYILIIYTGIISASLRFVQELFTKKSE